MQRDRDLGINIQPEVKRPFVSVDTTRKSPTGSREPATAVGSGNGSLSPLRGRHVAHSPVNEAKPMSDYMDEKFQQEHKSMFVLKAKL